MRFSCDFVYGRLLRAVVLLNCSLLTSCGWHVQARAAACFGLWRRVSCFGLALHGGLPVPRRGQPSWSCLFISPLVVLRGDWVTGACAVLPSWECLFLSRDRFLLCPDSVLCLLGRLKCRPNPSAAAGVCPCPALGYCRCSWMPCPWRALWASGP